MLSKPLPSQEEVEAQPKEDLGVLSESPPFQSIRSSIKNHQIESTKREALKEWEELRKPDEWDVALDQGKTKKTHRNKVANRRAGKSNPFQAAVDKRRRKQ